MNTLPKILYIDDEPENLVGFKVSFAKEYEVLTAENTIQGYEILKSSDILVAIIDYKMPAEDGISFIERIKEEFAEVIFIVISGYTDFEAVIKAINMNCLKNFVQKPWNYNEMRIVLKNAVESCEIRRENKKLLELLLENNRQLQESMERERKLSELKSVFLRNFSHEVRTPLNAIIGFASIAKEESREPAIANHLDICIQNSYQLLRIMESILLASVITTDQVEIYVEEFSPVVVMQEIMDSRSIKSSVKFLLEIDNKLKIVNDKDKIKTALDFLIDNALKFTDNGFVKVSAEESSEEEITFHVTDTGLGIADDKKDILFQPFRQCDETFERRHSGNGLGLFISKSLIEMLNGKIWYESEVGKGTTFSFTVKRKYP